jgi:uncharacterized protein YeaO (DUF488 family)
MLKQASIAQLRSGEVYRGLGYISVTMRTYPRGLKKELIDEYRSDLAPTMELFKEFKKFQAEVGHEKAFQACHYEERFELGRRALMHLEELAKMSQTQDVYLLCQCGVGERCHREILLWLANTKFSAKVAEIHNSYPIFFARALATP